MSAYIVAWIEESDPDAFERYRAEALPVVAKYGGRSLIQGTRHELLEGDWRPARVVVIEFPSADHARRFHASAEYQGPKELRQRAARTDMLLFEGRPHDE